LWTWYCSIACHHVTHVHICRPIMQGVFTLYGDHPSISTETETHTYHTRNKHQLGVAWGVLCVFTSSSPGSVTSVAFRATRQDFQFH
jgi:hypothetical protein